MIVIALITGLFWAFSLFEVLKTERLRSRMEAFTGIVLLHILAGMIIYLGFVFFIRYKAGMILLGLVVLISGFKWLQIFNKDFFSPFKRLRLWEMEITSDSYAFYFCFLTSLSQWNVHASYWNGILWVFMINILLAGFLLLLDMSKLFLAKHQWIEELAVPEAGIFLVVMGLIIMGGDVPFFVTGIEKILHIN